MFDISRVIVEALDRQDASGQDINQWLIENKDRLVNNYNPTASLNHNVFFHSTRVFQSDETRDLVELGSIKFNYRGKLIVEYDYHTTGTLYT
jgi:capsule polysaccharide export protein KpsE/RkpR